MAREESGMVSREAAFAESLQRIRRIAREQGNCISEEQVKEEFSDLEFRWCMTIWKNIRLA